MYWIYLRETLVGDEVELEQARARNKSENSVYI